MRSSGPQTTGARPVVVLGSTQLARQVPLGDWQLAHAFARLGHPVVYVDPPTSIASLRSLELFSTPPSPAPGEVRALATHVVRGSQRWWLERLQDRAYEEQVLRLLRTLGPDPLVLVATPVHGPLRRVQAAAQVVYWQRDRQWAEADVPRQTWLVRRHHALLHHADLVTGVSPEIVADNAAQGVVSHLVPNGADLSMWSTPHAEPPELRAVPRPRALFVGAWGWRVDVPLVQELVARAPDLHWVVVGAMQGQGVPASNVHFLGPRPYDVLPAYAQHADVGVIPYRHSVFNASSSPLKLFEYRAAGLPVITQGVSLPEGLSGVVAADGAAAWEHALRQAPGTAAARSQELRAFSWESRATTVLTLAGASGRSAAA